MMAEKRGPWTLLDRTSKYSSEQLEVVEDGVIKPDGDPGTYSFVKVKGGSSALPIDEEGFVYLIKEFRYAVARESIEAASGAIEEGLTAEETARKEMREEQGIEAEELIALGTVDPITSIIDSPSHLFLARGLRFVEKNQEGGETMETVKMKLDEAVEKVMKNEITHGASCVLILRAANYLKKR